MTEETRQTKQDIDKNIKSEVRSVISSDNFDKTAESQSKMKMQNQYSEPIGFIIQGDYITVVNPCTIPIEMMRKVLRKKRKKSGVTAVTIFKFLLKFLKGGKK